MRRLIFLALALLALAAPASAMMPGIAPVLAGMSAVPVAQSTYASDAVNVVNQSSFSFTSQGIGTAANNRYVVVCVTLRSLSSGIAISSLTVGGQATTLLSSELDTSAGDYAGLLITNAPVTSGTTATIAFTMTLGNSSGTVIGVWALTGLTSTTPTATAVSNASPPSASITASAGGTVLGCAMTDAGSSSFTWTNATKAFDIPSGGAHNTTSGANNDRNSAITQTVTATPAAGTGAMALAALR